VNGDGYDDVIVGALENSSVAAYVFLGGATGIPSGVRRQRRRDSREASSTDGS
jgi:hypothetical protein